MWQPWGGELASELGFIAMVFGWTSMVLMARQNVRAWPVGLVGDLFWTLACLDSGYLSFILNDTAYVALRLYGWWSWRQARERHLGLQ